MNSPAAELAAIEAKMSRVVDEHLAAMEFELRPLVRQYNRLFPEVVSPALRRATDLGVKVAHPNLSMYQR